MSRPPTDIELEIKILRREHYTACRELKEIKQLAALRRRESAEPELKWQIAALRVENAFLEHAYVRLKSGLIRDNRAFPQGARAAVSGRPAARALRATTQSLSAMQILIRLGLARNMRKPWSSSSRPRSRTTRGLMTPQSN